MTNTNLQILSTITADAHLELSLRDNPMPEPKEDEVLVRMETTPINPSDLAVLFGPADMTTARQQGDAQNPVIVADMPPAYLPAVKARIDKFIPVGNEGAGTVVAAGSSDAAQALMGW